MRIKNSGYNEIKIQEMVPCENKVAVYMSYVTAENVDNLHALKKQIIKKLLTIGLNSKLVSYVSENIDENGEFRLITEIHFPVCFFARFVHFNEKDIHLELRDGQEEEDLTINRREREIKSDPFIYNGITDGLSIKDMSNIYFYCKEVIEPFISIRCKDSADFEIKPASNAFYDFPEVDGWDLYFEFKGIAFNS